MDGTSAAPFQLDVSGAEEKDIMRGYAEIGTPELPFKAVSSITNHTFGTQTEEVGKKSDRKLIREIVRIKKFNKDRNERSALCEMPFANVYVSEIHCELIETEIEKHRQQAASKRAEVDFYGNKCKRVRKTLERKTFKNDNITKKQSEELRPKKRIWRKLG